MLLRQGIRGYIAPRTSDRQKHLWASGRWMHVIVATGSGRETINIFILYGYAGALENDIAFQNNEELFHMALEELALAGRTPSYIFGDFQLHPQQSPVLGSAQDADLIHDLHEIWCTETGQELEATCFPTNKI